MGSSSSSPKVKVETKIITKTKKIEVERQRYTHDLEKVVLSDLQARGKFFIVDNPIASMLKVEDVTSLELADIANPAQIKHQLAILYKDAPKQVQVLVGTVVQNTLDAIVYAKDTRELTRNQTYEKTIVLPNGKVLQLKLGASFHYEKGGSSMFNNKADRKVAVAYRMELTEIKSNTTMSSSEQKMIADSGWL